MKRTRWTRLNRREALGMLGIGAGLGLVSFGRGGALLSAWPLQAAAGRPGRIPKGAIIRPILKDLPPDGLGSGAVLFHQPMSFHHSFFETTPPANSPPPATPPP